MEGTPGIYAQILATQTNMFVICFSLNVEKDGRLPFGNVLFGDSLLFFYFLFIFLLVGG